VTPAEMYTKLRSMDMDSVPPDDLEKLSADDAPELVLKVAAQSLQKVAAYLANNEELGFGSLMCLSGLDLGEELQVVYHLASIKHKHKLTLKVTVPKASPEVPTVEGVWPTAGWHEREAFDLFGIEFPGHSDLRRILMPEDWEGHPLRKDYKPPMDYRGIPVLPREESPDSAAEL
jgi:NADH-quinone oxidoreductase subunit C